MKDFSKLKKQELLDLYQEKVHAIGSLNFSLAKSKPGEQSISSLKKDIARIKTALSHIEE